MKIAMIGHKRMPSREGGVEIVVEELAVRMVEMGHQVDCYNRWEEFGKNAPKLPKEYKGVHNIRIPTIKNRSLNAVAYSFLATLRALAGSYDVIHFHAEGPAAMSILTKIFRIPTVVTIHGLDWQRAKWGGFATRYLLHGEKNAVRFADELIVLSKGTQRYFQAMYGRETNYVPNGVNIHPYKPLSEIKKWGLKKDGYILFLARLVPEKGLHYLIEAFRGVKTDKRLVIAGKITSDDAYVQKICDMAGEDDRVVMTDFVEGEVLEELFCNCVLYVLPSDIEGMAISLLEALSYGARCLVSDIVENVELTGVYADYFKKGNVQMLRNQLQKILNEVENSEEHIKRINYVSKNYNWDSAVMETLRIYRRAMGEES